MNVVIGVLIILIIFDVYRYEDLFSVCCLTYVYILWAIIILTVMEGYK